MMKLRMCCRSPSVWNSRLEPPCDALAAAARTGAPSLLSASTAIRIRMKRRTMSSSTCTTSAPEHDEGQHEQRVGAAARQDPVGHVEQVEGDGQDEGVDDEGEDRDRDEVAPAGREPFGQDLAEFPLARALLEGRLPASASASAALTSAAARASRSGRRPVARGRVGRVQRLRIDRAAALLRIAQGGRIRRLRGRSVRRGVAWRGLLRRGRVRWPGRRRRREDCGSAVGGASLVPVSACEASSGTAASPGLSDPAPSPAGRAPGAPSPPVDRAGRHHRPVRCSGPRRPLGTRSRGTAARCRASMSSSRRGASSALPPASSAGRSPLRPLPTPLSHNRCGSAPGKARYPFPITRKAPR